MTCNISLDQPLLEQQSVREMLNLPNEDVNLQVSLENWIKIAVKLIKAELLDCSFDEDELLSFRLAYATPHPTKPDVKDIYELEWKTFQSRDIQERTVKNDIELNQDMAEDKPVEEFSRILPVSPDFLRRLSQRLDEGIFNSAPNLAGGSSISWNFQSSSQDFGPGLTPNCDGNCRIDNDIYLTLRNRRGQIIGCGKWCEKRGDEFPGFPNS
jgi:hypothetical protein